MVGDRDKDTICAVSTPPGYGGISVLRVSGPAALKITRALCPFLPGAPNSHQVYHGLLIDPPTHPENSKSQKAIDEVVVTWFGEGRSFTGEATAEISCHGNPLICREILHRLIEQGARAAERGEFTYRAFMNDRLDLIQAESVVALIESRSVEAARLAIRQLQGDLSKTLVALEDHLTWCLAHIEAGIDFSAEGVDVVDSTALQSRLAVIAAALGRLVDSFKSGRVLREGLRIALVGRPNVGKSSLLNTLLEDDRAIVTDIAGTTRDTIEGETMRLGRRFLFLDTAGQRESADPVEKLGIERSIRAAREADAVLCVIDAEVGPTAEDLRLLEGLDPHRTLVVVNKNDRIDAARQGTIRADLMASKFFTDHVANSGEKMCFVSALDKTSRATILDLVAKWFLPESDEGSAVLASARHFERLSHALLGVREGGKALRDGVGGEFVAIPLKEALVAIQETLGKRFDDQIMDRVFKEFCIGK